MTWLPVPAESPPTNGGGPHTLNEILVYTAVAIVGFVLVVYGSRLVCVHLKKSYWMANAPPPQPTVG